MVDSLADLRDLLDTESRATSIEVGLPHDATSALLFYDYAPLSERALEPSRYADDVHIRRLVYYIYKSFPSLVDQIIRKPGSAVRMAVPNQPVLPAVTAALEVLSWYVETVVIQSRLGDDDGSSIDVGWADHPVAFDVDVRILRRRALLELLAQQVVRPDRLVYLPAIVEDCGPIAHWESLGRLHAEEVAEASARLEAIPWVEPFGGDSAPDRGKGRAVHLPYLAGLSEGARRRLLSDRPAGSINEPQRLAAIPSTAAATDRVCEEFEAVATSLCQKFDQLESAGALARVGGSRRTATLRVFGAESVDSKPGLFLALNLDREPR